IKIIHYYFNMLGKPNKKKVIARDLGYHGSTYLAHALTGIKSTQIGFDIPTDLVHYVSAPYPYRRPEGMSEEIFCDHLIQELEDKIQELVLIMSLVLLLNLFWVQVVLSYHQKAIINGPHSFVKSMMCFTFQMRLSQLLDDWVIW
ncbi:MAG: hypothetical protein AAF705_18270, partial [Bacteroidota bacterium]